MSITTDTRDNGSSERISPDPALQNSKIERLSTASLRRVIEPDEEVLGHVGPGRVLGDELLSIVGLDLDLTEEQRITLSREELASVLDAGVRFEATLMAGFSRQVAGTRDLTDPRVIYMLHEVGEETRHSRLFIRVIEQLEPKAVSPFSKGILPVLDRFLTGLALKRHALFMVMVLVGEEGPDLIQRLALEHPETDPFIRDVNRYHRTEEARHLAFGRATLRELYDNASWLERWLVRHAAPAIAASIFDGLVHPGVYGTVGLPPWSTWNAVRKSDARVELRAQVLRPVCSALVKAGIFGRKGKPTRAWRRACAGPETSA